jgi:hypothetical protein
MQCKTKDCGYIFISTPIFSSNSCFRAEQQEATTSNRLAQPSVVEWRMPSILAINVALWGMLICLGLEVTGWIYAAS